MQPVVPEVRAPVAGPSPGEEGGGAELAGARTRWAKLVRMHAWLL